MQRLIDTYSGKRKLNALFVKKVKNKVKKLDTPVSFDDYRYAIIQQVPNFNLACSLDFLKKKYDDYLVRFYIFKSQHIGRFVVNLTDNLNIFSKNNIDPQYYIDRGWSMDEALIKIKDRQNTISGSINFRQTATNDQIIKRKQTIVDKQNKSRKKNENFQKYLKTTAFPTFPNYWMRKINPNTQNLYTELEATKMIDAVKKNNAKKSIVTKRLRDSFNSCRSVKGWLNRGFTIEEALAGVAIVQTTNSVSKYVEKYGLTVGVLKFKARQAKRLETLSKKTDEEKLALLMRKSSGFKKYSNASFVFFKNFITYLETNLGLINLTYYYGPNEHFIYDREKKKIYFYDFYIKELNFYIEFNGIKYHPNKDKLSKIEWINWKNPFSGITADDQYTIDQHKLKLVTASGGEIYIFWEQDCVHETYIRLGNIILDRYRQYENNKRIIC